MEGNSGRDRKGREVVEIGLCCSQDLSFKIDLVEMKKKGEAYEEVQGPVNKRSVYAEHC